MQYVREQKRRGLRALRKHRHVRHRLPGETAADSGTVRAGHAHVQVGLVDSLPNLMHGQRDAELQVSSPALQGLAEVRDPVRFDAVRVHLGLRDHLQRLPQRDSPAEVRSQGVRRR